MEGSEPSEAKPGICWRGDPVETSSDWTVVVTSKSGDIAGDDAIPAATTYHIHKHIVAAGPRPSQYVCQLFQATDLLETKNATTNLTLEKSSAVAFPLMLDFIYHLSTIDVKATTETAVALKNLANYFVVPSLLENINNFIKKDMNLDNIHIYIREAQLYRNKEIFQRSMNVAPPRANRLVNLEDQNISIKGKIHDVYGNVYIRTWTMR